MKQGDGSSVPLKKLPEKILRELILFIYETGSD